MAKLEDDLNIRNISKVQDNEAMIAFNYNDEHLNINGNVTYEGDIDSLSLVTSKPIVADKLRAVLEG